ncbi:ABC transporter permease [Ginsengibacter hankyongi]|uniref:ABC transporter permease n=1 Tax=Ginsengibacter hankyongi TaxID=2607284 RepID=A0A5J5II62_9BACT|nr:FtsX-like permease family protein [Ginsengibacter hankyongi]KAA9040596.1 ABC transporter permease [Ginsengibacter hankyongi]
MNYKLIISIAKSLLKARFRQTMIAAIGVTFSITMFIALLGFMTGLNDLLDGLILNRTPHIRLFNEIKPSVVQPVNLSTAYKGYYHIIHSIKSENSRQDIYNSQAVMQAIKADERVQGFAPKIVTQVFYNDGTVDITGVVNGIDPQAETRLFHFGDYIVSGSVIDMKNISNSIILGKALAERLNANLGDMVQIITVKGDRFPLKLVGLYQSGINDLDKTQGYVYFNTAQKLLGKSNTYFTDIQIKLKDLNEAPAVAKEYAKKFGTQAEDIQTANAQFETGSSVRTIISYSVGITLLIVAGFGIYNILNMMIYEKMDTIAILKATGFSGRDVKAIFIFIALSIGIVGGFLGLIFGFAFSAIIDEIPFHTPSLPTITTYPVNYKAVIYFIATAFSLITTYLAGLFPARKASKVDPVVIIRGK